MSRAKICKSLTVVSTLFLSSLAFADSVNITTVTNMTSPPNVSVSSNGSVGFNPGTSLVVFKAADKTCTFTSSGNPYGSGGGAGCNYSLTVNSSTNTLSNPGSNGKGCTAASDMLAACK